MRIHPLKVLPDLYACVKHTYAPRRGLTVKDAGDQILTVTSARPTSTWRLEKCRKLASQLSRFQGCRRSSGRSRHANHPGSSPAVQEKITPHIPQTFFGLPFFNFPPYFFKVADLRFNTFLDTKRAIRRCWRSLRSLKMLPIDSPSNFTLNGMFDPHFRKRSLAKIQKIRKNLPGR